MARRHLCSLTQRYQGAENREDLADVKRLRCDLAGSRSSTSIRTKVEHPFRIIKRQFGFVKARFKELRKNDNQLAMLFTLVNLFRVDQMIRAWDSCAQKSR